jgi:hypothetical protein
VLGDVTDKFLEVYAVALIAALLFVVTLIPGRIFVNPSILI